MSTCESQRHVLAAIQLLLKALEASNLDDNVKRVVVELDSHLSAIISPDESPGDGFMEVEEQLKCAESEIMRWELSPSLIFDSGLTETSKYLHAIRAAIASIGEPSISGNRKRRELSNRAQCVVQIAMSRLQLEVYQVILQHKKYLEPQRMSFRSGNVVIYNESSLVSSEEDEIPEERASTSRQSMEYSVELIDPQVIAYVRSIADVMFASSYGKDFCDAFIGIREAVIDEHLTNLQIEKLSIEEVLKLDWESWNSKIKRWIWAVKIIIQVYLPSEKRLCDQILSEFDMNSYCFTEISKASVLCLMNFGQAIAIGPRNPENLISLLDMYETLDDLAPSVDVLFSEEASFIKSEFQSLLKTLSESSMATFLKLGDTISSRAFQPPPAGKIHPLTNYTMNYIKHLTMYHEILNNLLRDNNMEDPDVPLDTDIDADQFTPSLTACRFHSIVSSLECKLVEISKLYQDESLQHIFLANNVHYMVQKVMDDELRPLFGDEWIRRHNGLFQQHTNCYVRATWTSVLSLLRNDRRSCEERCRRFCCAFDDVYKTQTRWCVPHAGLRTDLQIKISNLVIPAYRHFLGNNEIHERHVKFSVDDLENLLLDLFAGLPRSPTLRNSRRQ